MSRHDMHLDAMLRHLGAAYYDSLYGRAAPGDVTRAVNQVASQMGEKPAGRAPAQQQRAGDQEHHVGRHHGQWHSRVRDVMTADVVTVDRITPFKEIAGLLVEHRISGMPVLRLGRHVAGVVSEADLIAARDTHAGSRRTWAGKLRYSTDRERLQRLTAEQLMTAPAITIHPDATIAAAARLMSMQRVKRLPVVDADGTLVGVVSRRDLLNVFLVPDAEVARQVREVIDEVVPDESAAIKVSVHGGVVTLTGTPGHDAPHGPLATAVELAWDLDGVVDVIEHVEHPEAA